MEFVSKYYDNHLVFEARDLNLDTPGVLRYKRELSAALFQEENISNIVLQFKDVILKDNVSLGALLYAHRFAKGREGNCILISPTVKTVSLLKMAKLDKAFTILTDEKKINKLLKTLQSKEKKSDLSRNEEEVDNKNEDDNSSEKYPVDGDFKFIE
ncbi:MAG: hypothetical protein KAI81_01120 [Candidatus Marinimicrobia bacterium]|nr:hypothetical protein [Candidatus Neomarinimicrobiota bacterium]